MARLSLYLIGVAAGLAVLLSYRNRSADPARRRVPVRKAADLLREAWADHHTAP